MRLILLFRRHSMDIRHTEQQDSQPAVTATGRQKNGLTGSKIPLTAVWGREFRGRHAWARTDGRGHHLRHLQARPRLVVRISKPLAGFSGETTPPLLSHCPCFLFLQLRLRDPRQGSSVLSLLPSQASNFGLFLGPSKPAPTPTTPVMRLLD